MKNYKIYLLSDPITNEIRYVGQTCNSLKNRLAQHVSSIKNQNDTCYRTNWIKSLNKQKLIPNIILIKENLNKTECNELEKYYIKFYKDQNIKLTNMTEGGEGSVGFKHTLETKQKLSKMKKLMMTEEYKNNLKIKGKEKWLNMSEQEILNTKINQPTRKNIYQYDLEGNFIKMFISLREIERELGFFRANISPCIKGVFKQAYGYSWRHE